MNKRKKIFVLVVLMVCSLLSGCVEEKQEARKELLIYCGITMIKPMAELAKMIEEQENCRVIITKGGSGNLLKSIHSNEVGDLYLPGSASYIKTAVDEGLVTESVHVGNNKAAMMVAKGNPRNIPADLTVLADPDYYVVLGNPSSGSIGRETKKILDRRGIFNEVMANVKRLTTDSKDLVLVFKEKEAHAVLNWLATSPWGENREYVDVLPISSELTEEKRLVLGLLKWSREPEIARKFMALAASDTGRALFEKYGLYTLP